MTETITSLSSPVANQPKQRKLFSSGIAGAIVALIIVCEVVLAHFYLTTGELPRKTEVPKAAANEYGPVRDVDLGKFSLSAMDSNSSGTLLIEFHLVGSVDTSYPEKEAEGGGARDGFVGIQNASSGEVELENATFEKLFQREKSQFRDRVIVVVGRAQISALSDPDFGAIKGRLLKETNSLLGAPLLKAIRFSDFTVVQQ